MAKTPLFCRLFGHSYKRCGGEIAIESSYRACTRAHCEHIEDRVEYEALEFEVNWWWDRVTETGRDLHVLQNDQTYRTQAWDAVNEFKKSRREG